MTANDAFQRLVADADDLFSSEFLARSVVGLDDKRLETGSRHVTVLNCAEQAEYGIHDLFCIPDWEQETIILDRRFALYVVDQSEIFSNVREEFSEIFWSLPFSEKMNQALRQLNQALDDENSASIHIRRLHLTSNTSMQLNRFDSYLEMDTYCDVAAHLLDNVASKLLIAADNDTSVDYVRRRFPGRAISVRDVMDISELTGIQRALLDMVFLSHGKSVCGPLSAYGIIASYIGNISYRNVAWYAARNKLDTTDRSGAIGLLRASFEGRVGDFASTREIGPNDFGLAYRMVMGTVHSAPTVALDKASIGLAQLIAGAHHPVVRTDWGLATHALEMAARSNDRPDVVDALEQFRQMVNGHQADVLPRSNDKILTRVRSAQLAARADHANTPADYQIAISAARDAAANPRGIFLRWARSLANAGALAEAIDICRQAVAEDPHFAESWAEQAEIMAQAHQEEARDVALRACELDREDARYWYILGTITEDCGLLSEARNAYQEAVRAEPENFNYRNCLIHVSNT
ncbi:tetratricopeptide repeat protein [Nitrospirillum sp. BR 11164]|uniref:tetratricopeptide repeat protein n=1 Tax=Nitrospirillum sp. BR 11164 TaxID=3104324 RepID=UPI002AFF5336|nr:tetratricopeptide repeat protein [Nitrospirillum sp. BR 11164]MEA1649022.1 tetratricopeptide repeat protein [Nitrospirillum sp. BR 11164]